MDVVNRGGFPGRRVTASSAAVPAATSVRAPMFTLLRMTHFQEGAT